MKGKSNLLIVLFTALSFAASATDSQTTFSELDKDSNGKLSEAEASEDAVLHENFAEMDADQDGQISYVEFSNFFQ